MSVTLTAVGVTGSGQPDNTQREGIYDFTVALTGNYGGAATHGDTVVFPGAISGQVPALVEFYEAPPAGTLNTGYRYTYCPGATQNVGVLQIDEGFSQPPTEIGEGGAYPAALLACTWLRCRAWFAKNL